ncbi:general odorant-binding protein 56d-like [Trichoplusia ni]|uniref:General odorant-binding protein 56d-like n=1 Tax=Trichoplusia ni TaxID=7111 RepID=A0A7E5W731_TRINI|nr:general odorant-binding protein 56d-like [Trichoplusia ni]
MKSFVILCIVVAGINAHSVHLPETQKEKAQAISKECIKESGVKTEVLEEAKKGHLSEDETFKKFVHCFFHKADIVNADGKLNLDVALAKLPPGIDKADAEKLLKGCMNHTGKDAVDKTYEIFKCYYHGTKVHILF